MVWRRTAGLGLTLALVLMAGNATAQTWPDLSKPAASVGGGSKDAALVISIERYGNLPPIPGAEANGRAWYLHLTKTLKVPVAQVKWLNNSDAAKENIEDAADNVASWVKPGGTMWLVFIGHGAPAADGSDGVLVGQDAQQTARMLYARSVPQKTLLRRLGAGKQARTVAVIDACFSGRSNGGQALAKGLMPTLAARQGRLSPGTTVLSAGTSKQFAGPLPGGARPAFSYLVLGALRGWGDADANGSVTAAEAVGYAGGVLRSLVKGRSQTPQVHGATAATLSRVGLRPEKGPDLAAIGAAPAAADPAGTFGRGIGRATTLPTVGSFVMAAPKTSLGSVDIGLLKRLQTAKRADANGELAYPAVAAAWDALGRHPSAGSMSAQAERRRVEWTKLNTAVCTRRAELAKVRAQYRTDQSKLSELLALDDNVVSAAQKQAYRAELRAAYAQWKAALAAPADARARCSRSTATHGKVATIDPAPRSAGGGCKTATACWKEGEEHYTAGAYATARVVHRRGCDLAGGSSCTTLGYLYAKGKGGTQDHRAAAKLYAKACTLNSGQGCSNLGVNYRWGRGVTKNRRTASFYYDKGCNLGNMLGCNNLGWDYQKGTGRVQSYSKARGLYEKACKASHYLACTNLGWLYSEGKGVTRSEATAVKYYRQACDGGNAGACANLGYNYAMGRGVPKNDKQAVRLYQKACKGNSLLGCNNFAVRLRDGKGVTRDPKRALVHFEKACDLQYPNGCAGAAGLYSSGRGTRKDRGKAKALHRKACKLGRKASCKK